MFSLDTHQNECEGDLLKTAHYKTTFDDTTYRKTVGTAFQANISISSKYLNPLVEALALWHMPSRFFGLRYFDQDLQELKSLPQGEWPLLCILHCVFLEVALLVGAVVGRWWGSLLRSYHPPIEDVLLKQG